MYSTAALSVMLAGDFQQGKEGDIKQGVKDPTDFYYPLENMHFPSFVYVVA